MSKKPFDFEEINEMRHILIGDDDKPMREWKNVAENLFSVIVGMATRGQQPPMLKDVMDQLDREFEEEFVMNWRISKVIGKGN
jgi:hypothetical protein